MHDEEAFSRGKMEYECDLFDLNAMCSELKADDAKLLLSTPSGWQSIMRETELAVKSVPTFYLYSNLNSTVFQTLTKSLNDTFTDDALRKTPVAANQSIRRV